MYNFYYWKPYLPPERGSRSFYSRDADVLAQTRNKTYLAPQPEEPVHIEKLTFIKVYGKGLLCSSFVGLASLIILVRHFFDFTLLGAGFFWYVAVLGMGIAAGIGLPIYWARCYKRYITTVDELNRDCVTRLDFSRKWR